MKFWIHVTGHKKPKVAKQLVFQPNWAGQGGEAYITMHDNSPVDKRIYYMLQPETEEDATELLRQAHVAYRQFHDERARKEQLVAIIQGKPAP